MWVYETRGLLELATFAESIQTTSYLPLRLQVYKSLRDAIVTGKLKAGERIVEDRVCAELGVSRSPLREALRRLEGEGLVSILPRRGAVVTEVTDRDGVNLFAVREVLEGLAARQAARHITADELAELESVLREMADRIKAKDATHIVALNTQFHDLVAKASRNRWARDFLAAIRAQTRRIYRSSLDSPGRAPSSLSEHLLILKALEIGDVEAAEGLAREHVRKAHDAAVSIGITSDEGE